MSRITQPSRGRMMPSPSRSSAKRSADRQRQRRARGRTANRADKEGIPCGTCEFVAASPAGRSSHRRARHPDEPATPPAETSRQDSGALPAGLSVLDAVRTELDRAAAARKRPGLAAAALRLAALLDDPDATPQIPSAAKQLRDLLDALHDAGQTGSKLGELRGSPQLRAIRGGAADG